jgi:trk system potassium uptake protein TrkA
MNIIVVGAGEVGRHLCLTLSLAEYSVTVIEMSHDLAEELEESQNIRVITGNGASAGVLQQAGVAECDTLLAMTSDDRTNILASSLAKAMGARRIITRIHDHTYSDNSLINYQLHFGIDLLINPEALAAVELAKAIRNPGRVAVENFARGNIEVQQLRVSRRSRVVGQSLKELRIPSGVRVGLLEHDGQEAVPTADSTLAAGDFVTLVGPPEALCETRVKFDPDTRADDVHRVVLFGGSETAIALVRLLKNPRFKVRLFETDAELCRQLAESFPHITVIQGSATSLRLLEEEQVSEADYFVACTKDDEDNIMTCLQARKIGVPHVQLVFSKPDYEEVLADFKATLGVKLAVSPRQATVAEVMRTLSLDPCQELATVPNGTGKILEVRVHPDSSAVGKPLREVALPRGAIIVALLHKQEARVPGAGDCIEPGDRIVAIVEKDKVDPLVRLMTTRAS